MCTQITHAYHQIQRNALLTRRTSPRDVLHPSRPNCSKDELREKLAQLYKANKDQVSVFGFRTHFGGGKSTGFALIYDSHEAMKKFEPHYRLVRVGAAQKIEKASRQQRMFYSVLANLLYTAYSPAYSFCALPSCAGQVSNSQRLLTFSAPP